MMPFNRYEAHDSYWWLSLPGNRGRLAEGTRVPVDTLFEYLESGKSLDDFIDQYPTSRRDKAVAIVEVAKRRFLAEASTG